MLQTKTTDDLRELRFATLGKSEKDIAQHLMKLFRQNGILARVEVDQGITNIYLPQKDSAKGAYLVTGYRTKSLDFPDLKYLSKVARGSLEQRPATRLINLCIDRVGSLLPDDGSLSTSEALATRARLLIQLSDGPPNQEMCAGSAENHQVYLWRTGVSQFFDMDLDCVPAPKNMVKVRTLTDIFSAAILDNPKTESSSLLNYCCRMMIAQIQGNVSLELSSKEFQSIGDEYKSRDQFMSAKAYFSASELEARMDRWGRVRALSRLIVNELPKAKASNFFRDAEGNMTDSGHR